MGLMYEASAECSGSESCTEENARGPGAPTPPAHPPTMLLLAGSRIISSRGLEQIVKCFVA